MLLKDILPKPMRFRIRDEIEKIIKEEQIDRSRFYVYSKLHYDDEIAECAYMFRENMG